MWRLRSRELVSEWLTGRSVVRPHRLRANRASPRNPPDSKSAVGTAASEKHGTKSLAWCRPAASIGFEGPPPIAQAPACSFLIGDALMLQDLAIAQSQTTTTQIDKPNRVSVAYGATKDLVLRGPEILRQLP